MSPRRAVIHPVAEVLAGKVVGHGRATVAPTARGRPAVRDTAADGRQVALVLPILLPGSTAEPGEEEGDEGLRGVQGQPVVAVIYDGLDPVTGRERRSWHPAGTDRAEAERLARQLAAKANGQNDGVAP